MPSNILIIAGTLLLFFGIMMKFEVHLPGDILIKKENFTIYFPIVSLIVISIFVNIILYFFKETLINFEILRQLRQNQTHRT